MKRILALFLVYIFVLGLGGCSKWSDEKVDESKKRGDRIIAALENYRNEHSAYPNSLNDLMPKYLKSIEPPVAGNCKWRYDTYEDGKAFRLIFEDETPDEPTGWYDSKKERWSLDTK